MLTFLALVRRELGGFLGSISGYVIISTVAGLLGLSFSYIFEAVGIEDKPLDMPLTELFYNTFYFWLILLITAPVVTMRSFAQEKALGTFETLMTAPVGDWQVVLAKYTGAWVFYMIAWLPLLGCLAVARRFVNDPAILDPGLTASTFLGIGLVASVYVSAGCFASALTRNQVVAAMIAFGIGIVLFVMSFFSMVLPPRPTWQSAVLKHISMFDHMQDFVRGIVDTRHMIFYASLTGLFLFLTVRVVESRHWR